MKTIGILALQGDFAEHARSIESAGAKAKFIKHAKDLDGIQGLIIPGGESTVIGMLAEKYKLIEPVRNLIKAGLPTLATCAGLILLADKIHSQKEGGQPSIGGLNIVVDRNFNGSQVNSFEANLAASKIFKSTVSVMFIRPPRILRTGAGVEVLATFDFGSGDEPVLIQQANILGASLHTELGIDQSLHNYFIRLT